MFVKAYVAKGTEYVASFNDTPYVTDHDYWTTVKVEEQDIGNDHYIKHLAKSNLTKTIAQREFGNIKYHKSIWLDLVDIKIVR